MLSALLSLVVSMGIIGVLAGVVSGMVFLVEAALMWGNSLRSSLQSASSTTTSSSSSSPPPRGIRSIIAPNEPNGFIAGGRLSAGTGAVTAADRPTSPFPRLETLRARTTGVGAAGAGDDATTDLDSRQAPEPALDLGDLGLGDLAPERPDLPEFDPGLGEGPVAGVRQLMERLVETLVSGDLDDVALRPKEPHPQYNRVYKRHQPRLRSALTSLAYSLQMALSRKPLSECDTPGPAHAQLRAIILDLARDVAALEQEDQHADHSGRGGTALGLDHNDFAGKAYEDILATAIVNKVMERSSSRTRKSRHNLINNNNFISSLEVRLGSVDSPELESTSSWTGSWTSSGHLDPESPPVPSAENTGLPDADAADSELGSDPLSLMIEECIEEVTTITASSSPSTTPSSSADEYSDDASRWEQTRGWKARRRRQRRTSARLSGSSSTGMMGTPTSGPPSILAGLSFLNKRVPFPELGVDIVDADWTLASDASLSESESRTGAGSAESEAEDTAWPRRRGDGDEPGEDEGEGDSRPASCLELVTPLQSWEDNWLFQSRRERPRRPDTQHSHHPVPVPMLVPNPSEDFRALIGDVDAEETSDLSECSDDVLEELVMSGSSSGLGLGRHSSSPEDGSQSEPHPELHPELRLERVPDPRSLNVSALEGLAETCNVELLKRAAHISVTKGNPLPRLPQRPKIPQSPRQPKDEPPEDQDRSDILDKDADLTVVYDTPPMKELPVSARNGVSTASQSTSSSSVPRPATLTQLPPGIGGHADDDRMELPEKKLNGYADKIVSAQRDVKVEQTVGANEYARKDQTDTRESYQFSLPERSKPEEDGMREPSPSSHTSLVDEIVPHDLATPPRPGTIAEREHRKWMEARPLPNNPYSPENIERRLRQRTSHAGPVLPVNPAVDTTSSSSSLPPGSALQIALRVDPDPKKYGRDFYINSRGSSNPPSTKRNSSSCVENGNGVEWTPTLAAVRTNGDGGAEEFNATEEHEVEAATAGQIGAPSVKQLAKQFLSQPHQEEQGNTPHVSKGPRQSRVVIVPKDPPAVGAAAGAGAAGDPAAERRPVRQVHSLTARSMSKEFREGLRHISGLPVTRTTRPLRPDPEGARQPTDSES